MVVTGLTREQLTQCYYDLANVDEIITDDFIFEHYEEFTFSDDDFLTEVDNMNDFIKALRAGKGFNYLTDYEKYQSLSKDDLRNIAKELIYAIEEEGEADVYDTVIENLTDYI